MFSYLWKIMIVITLIYVKAKLFPIHALGPLPNTIDTKCSYFLFSSFSHLYGINSWGFSNSCGLCKKLIQLLSTSVPLARVTPPTVISFVAFLWKLKGAELNILSVSRIIQSKNEIFFIFSTVISPSYLITAFIYSLNLLATYSFSKT